MEIKGEAKSVSVVLSIYNVEAYLKKCIDSIINQTHTNLEIILVDDGSTDDCPGICDEYAQKDCRIKVIHKQNGGPSSARNSGIDIATGEYICFFDGDDFVEIDMVEMLLKAIQEYDNDVCVCGYSVDEYDAMNKLISTKEVAPYFSYLNRTFSLSEYERILGWCGYTWNKLYKRKLLMRCHLRFEEGISLGEDLLFNAEVFLNAAKVRFLPYVGYHYIQRKRESLGVKYYPNFFLLKQRAIKAKCQILQYYGVEEKLITQFTDNNYIDAVWGALKNLKNTTFTLKEKSEKAAKIIKAKEVKSRLKKIKTKDKKRKMKKCLLLWLCPRVLLRIIN